MIKKTSDIIAEFLKEIEIKVVFGIIGSANSHIFDSIQKLGYTEIVCVHHEQAAVLAAGAYFRTSGKLSAAIVTAGAGSSNAITGVVSNWADSIPCLIISGQEPTIYLTKHENLRMFGIQGFDAPKMVRDVTKYSKTVMYPDSIQSELELAYHLTLEGRPGPVWIDIPFDIQSAKVEKREWNFHSRPKHAMCDAWPMLVSNDLEYITKTLQESKRPLIWAGHGVRLSGAKESFRQLVSKLKIPTILTWSGIDLLEDDHEWNFGRAGVMGHRSSNFIIQNADVILVLGSRLSLLQTGYDTSKFNPKAKIILVDLDSREWQKNYQLIDRFIQLDCKYFINELLKSISNDYQVLEWELYCRNIRKKYPILESTHINGGDEYINSYKFIEYIQPHLKDDQIIVTDMGTGLLSGHYSIKLKRNQTMFTSLGLGEMGYGLPGAIGAAFAGNGREVLCLNCDGGMMMNLQELQTIIHHKLPIKIIVFNNDGYLMIKHTQKMLFKGEYTSVNKSTGVSLPDYRILGEAFGFYTTSITGFAEQRGTIQSKLSDFFSYNGPAIMEVYMSPEQEFIPKARGTLQEDGKILPALLEEMSPLLPLKEIQENMISGVNDISLTIKRPCD